MLLRDDVNGFNWWIIGCNSIEIVFPSFLVPFFRLLFIDNIWKSWFFVICFLFVSLAKFILILSIYALSFPFFNWRMLRRNKISDISIVTEKNDENRKKESTNEVCFCVCKWMELENHFNLITIVLLRGICKTSVRSRTVSTESSILMHTKRVNRKMQMRMQT